MAEDKNGWWDTEKELRSDAQGLPKMSTFCYTAKFYEESGSFIDSDSFDIVVRTTDDPEHDRDEASSAAYDYADSQLEVFDAHSYEITLTDAC